MGMTDTTNIKCINLKRNDVYTDTVMPPYEYLLMLMQSETGDYSGGFEVISDVTAGPSYGFYPRATIGACAANSIILFHQGHVPASWYTYTTLNTNLLITTFCVNDDGNIVGQLAAPLTGTRTFTSTDTAIKYARFYSTSNFILTCSTVEYCQIDSIYSGSTTPTTTENIIYADTVNNLKYNYLASGFEQTGWNLTDTQTTTVNEAYMAFDPYGEGYAYMAGNVLYCVKYGYAASSFDIGATDIGTIVQLEMCGNYVLASSIVAGRIANGQFKFNEDNEEWEFIGETKMFSEAGWTYTHAGWFGVHIDVEQPQCILMYGAAYVLISGNVYVYTKQVYYNSDNNTNKVFLKSQPVGIDTRSFEMHFTANVLNGKSIALLETNQVDDGVGSGWHRYTIKANMTTGSQLSISNDYYYSSAINPTILYLTDSNLNFNMYKNGLVYSSSGTVIFSSISSTSAKYALTVPNTSGYREIIVGLNYDAYYVPYSGSAAHFIAPNIITRVAAKYSADDKMNIVYLNGQYLYTYEYTGDATYASYATKIKGWTTGTSIFTNILIQPNDFATDNANDWVVNVEGNNTTPGTDNAEVINLSICASTLNLLGLDSKNSTNLYMKRVANITTANVSYSYGALTLSYTNTKPVLTSSYSGITTIKSAGYLSYVPINTYVFDWRKIGFENANNLDYNEFSVKMTQKIDTTTGYLKNIKTTGYQLDFSDKWYVFDEIKYFDYDDYLVVLREDLISEFAGCYIINGVIYNSSDEVVTFRSDENFYIQLTDGSVIAYYDDGFCHTMMGSIPDENSESNIIISCFQVLRPPTSVSFRNQYNWNDSPLEASISYIDTTREYVIRS